ncbi:hypothetical protein FF125_09530 [Aureibaculum algae]|uniref:Uncharacterized protein n=1 Tax=Aureibaculum algae TaxID=2584122 RepID=A0A5B7TTN3_9FLAO|nr:hypothetical protein [Aureibaculum algae]QCX38661.1 hypothetical protein FF125_09530 [Aureibaculum algae]
MGKRILAYSKKMKGDLDDDYILYEDGEILHEYDKHPYPGGYNLKDTLTVDKLNIVIKERLLKATKEENKELVKQILGIVSE